MATKIKTARGTEPNAGLRAQFAQKLYRLSRRFQRMVFDEILAAAVDPGSIAQDASLTNPANGADPKVLEMLAKKIREDFNRNPDEARQKVDLFISKNIDRWARVADHESRKIAVWLARNLCADVTASQRLALKAAGLPLDFMRTRWSVPVGRTYVSPTAARLLPTLVDDTVGLITKLTMSDVAKIQNVITGGIAHGESIEELKSTLRTLDGFDETRVKTVSIDQTNKIAQGIQRGNDADLGIRQGVWVHVPGQYTSRSTHQAFHGRVFDLDKGLYDADVGDYVLPAQCINCRCFYKPVIPKDIFK